MTNKTMTQDERDREAFENNIFVQRGSFMLMVVKNMETNPDWTNRPIEYCSKRKLDKLQEELETLKQEDIQKWAAIKSQEKEIETLKARNKLLEDGIDFYADENNWTAHAIDMDYQDIIDSKDVNISHSGINIGGKLARQLQQSRIKG